MADETVADEAEAQREWELVLIRARAIYHSHRTANPHSVEAVVARQRSWSLATFGPGDNALGLLDHIRKELREIEANPTDVEEWVDVVILALDGAWRAGHSPETVANALREKQAKNEARRWPDWRTAEPGKAIEHVRDEEMEG